MAYTKNTWADGDIVTSEKLNHIEDGIANGGGVMIINDTDGTLDKTWQEINDAMKAGTFCVVKKEKQMLDDYFVYNYPVVQAKIATIAGTYNVNATFYGGDDMEYTTTSATGYPESNNED